MTKCDKVKDDIVNFNISTWKISPDNVVTSNFALSFQLVKEPFVYFDCTIYTGNVSSKFKTQYYKIFWYP